MPTLPVDKKRKSTRGTGRRNRSARDHDAGSAVTAAAAAARNDDDSSRSSSSSSSSSSIGEFSSEDSMTNDDDTVVAHLAERLCRHPASGSGAAAAAAAAATSIPVTVHVVETLAELETMGVEMDHVAVIERDLDVVPVAVAPSASGAAATAQRRHDPTNGSATSPNANSSSSALWLSAEDRDALQRNMIVKDWQCRVSTVRIVNRPFFAGVVQPQPQPQPRRHDGHGANEAETLEIPTFVCHEYDPRSIHQVARMIHKMACAPTATSPPLPLPPQRTTAPTRGEEDG
jgi:hypothetical protein